ncbi:MAG: CBS domain-containing protein [Deltaproteobacteria bacterium]|nr:CBS domain-containing protein [Deltaproteobacteria bacterium]
MINLTARDIMNRDVLSVGMDWSIDHLADYLIDNCISGAPVTSEDGKLLGVVSLTDIVGYRSLPATDAQLNDPHEYYIHCPERQYSQAEIESFRVETESLVMVREIMTPMTFNVKEDTKLQQVADAMIRGRIHRVFVTREDKLMGIITTMDILKTIRDL